MKVCDLGHIQKNTLAALRMRDDFHGIAANALVDQQRALMRQVFDALWLDHNQIIAVRSPPLYLPLAAAVVEWENSVTVQKGAGQRQLLMEQ